MTRFIIIFLLFLASCSSNNTIEDENCDCKLITYQVTHTSNIVVNTKNVTVDCYLNNTRINEFYNSDGSLSSFQEYFCTTNQ